MSGCASGALGELALVSCYQWDAGPPSPAFRGTSGGIAVDMGVHEFDQLRWLTGQELGSIRDRGPGRPRRTARRGCRCWARSRAGRPAFVSLGQSFPHGDCVWVEVFGTAGYERCEVLWGAGGDAALHRALRAQARAFAARVAGGSGGDAATAQDALLTLRAAERVHPG